MVYYHNTPENINLLSELTGIPTAVCDQWLRCEGQSRNNPTNPLNILYPTKKYQNRPKQIGQLGRFGVYASIEDGIRDAAWLVNISGYYKSIRDTVRSNPNNMLAIAMAIENSPWAAGHYGHSCISSHFRQDEKPTPPPTPTPPDTTTGNTYTVRSGDTLWEIASKFLGHGSRWPDIYNANRTLIGPDPNYLKVGTVLTIPGTSSKPPIEDANKKYYTVEHGDSLWAIAVKYYNDGRKWKRIYDANKAVIGKNPSVIHVGTRLIIP